MRETAKIRTYLLRVEGDRVAYWRGLNVQRQRRKRGVLLRPVHVPVVRQGTRDKEARKGGGAVERDSSAQKIRRKTARRQKSQSKRVFLSWDQPSPTVPSQHRQYNTFLHRIFKNNIGSADRTREFSKSVNPPHRRRYDISEILSELRKTTMRQQGLCFARRNTAVGRETLDGDSSRGRSNM